MAVPLGELRIQVVDDELIVSLPESTYSVTYSLAVSIRSMTSNGLFVFPLSPGLSDRLFIGPPARLGQTIELLETPP